MRACTGLVVVFLALLVAPTAAQQVPPEGTRAHVIRLAADQGTREILDNLGFDGLNYGSFIVLRVHSSELAALKGAGVRTSELEGAGQVHLPGFRFDPVTEGEPQLPAHLVAKAAGPRLRLLLLKGPLHQSWRELLQQRRLRLLQYLPHHTYLVWSDGSAADLVAAKELTSIARWSGEYHPAYKISPTLTSHPWQQHRRRLLILTLDQEPAAQTRAAIEATGASIMSEPVSHHWWPFRKLVAGLGLEQVEAVARLPSVVWIGPYDQPIRLGDELSAMAVAGEYDEQVLHPGYRSWLATQGYDGGGVVWSVLDSGVDPNHPDLQLSGGHSHGCETSVPGDDTDPPIGHGTAVAGIVAGTGSTGMTDAEGFLYGLGIAPGAHLFAQNFCWQLNGFGPPAGGWSELSQVAEQAGAVGTNNSWGTGSGSAEHYRYLEVSQSYDLLVRDADPSTPDIAEEQIMVFCAGNSGPDPATIWTPAQAKNVISVGATLNARESPYSLDLVPSPASLDQVVVYSSRGPTADGRFAPTVVAPGEGVITTRHARGGEAGGYWEIPDTGGRYSIFGGCSSATPHVSGALAVISQWWRNHHDGADASPAMARALLVNGAVDISGAPPVPNNDEGWGRIHLGHVINPELATIAIGPERELYLGGWVTAGSFLSAARTTLA